jgi:hypothetical protein
MTILLVIGLVVLVPYVALCVYFELASRADARRSPNDRGES